ncbi:helix-turn-helix domain-containing protein [Actinoplanes siamensis]|uniref:HTH cro/C1-type domain-containing protein n=1 Tax=Actinoplanes siamensis TaxID=1223317 RepID=A0A919ND28_9ACTN|nr:helix-turn-helix transcriptional regulator [Actinoplanes siamensis]GIF08906.1 hypothetical protein Asi03nite_64440 [Actinoplanes siamensis]
MAFVRRTVPVDPGDFATSQLARQYQNSIAANRSPGDIYNITINGGAEKAQLPSFVAAIAATKDALEPDLAQQKLSQVLAEARVKAGKPKLRTLARAVTYSESMLSRVFNGRLLPTRDKLEALAEQLDVDMSTFTTVWLPLWEAANRKPAKPKPAVAQTEGPAEPPPASECFVCAACKGWIRLIDAPGHIEWHTSLGQEQFPIASVTHLRPVGQQKPKTALR